MRTKIEWATHTANPITGCTPISEGCANCYARRMSWRLAGRFGYPADEPFRPGVFHEKQLDAIIKAPAGARVFVGSMGDIFHDDVMPKDAYAVLGAIRRSKATCMILTKRPRRMRKVLEVVYDAAAHFYSPNLWVGTTAENQQRADERIPELLRIPAAVRFVSVEPMLGPVDFGGWLDPMELYHPPNRLNWVICGAETGPGARPMNLDWARALRDECQDAGVPFFFKKAGRGRETPPDLDIHEYPEL